MLKIGYSGSVEIARVRVVEGPGSVRVSGVGFV